MFVRVFLLFGFHVVAAHVEPPANVTLRCGNMRDVVQWDYANLSWSQGLRFRVEILSTDDLEGFPKQIWVDSLPLQADVSFLSHPHDYLVTVTAERGQEESEPAPEDGIMFSYFSKSMAPQKCFLDFPSVTIVSQPQKMLLRFDHPWEVYLNKNQEVDWAEALPPFKYSITLLDQPAGPSSECEQSVCEESVLLDRVQDRYCVQVSGELEKMEVKGREEYCSQGAPEASYGYVYVGVGVLVVLVSVLLGYMAYRRLTCPPSSLPSPLIFSGPFRNSVCHPESPVNVETRPVLEDRSPTTLTPELPDQNFTPTPSDYEGRMRLGVPAEDEGVSDVLDVGGRGDPEYLQGNELEDGDGPVSNGYERRDVLVNIDPTEPAQGYRG